MQIGNIQGISPNRPAEVKPKNDLPASRDPILASLRNTGDDKALAKARLERAKQFLEMLKRWSFPPDVVARQAARLGAETRSALQQYVSAAGGEEADFSAATSSEADPVPAARNETDEPAEARPNRSFVEKAYLEAMDGSGEAGSLSAVDHRIVAEFKALLREIRVLQERAEREAHRADDTPDAVGADVTPISPHLDPGTR